MLEADVLERIRLIEGHLMPESFDPPSLYGRRLRMFTLLREPLSRLRNTSSRSPGLKTISTPISTKMPSASGTTSPATIPC